MVSGQNLMPTQSLVGASRATSDNTASPTEGSTGSSADSFRSGLQSLLISLNAESDGLGPDATEDGGSDLSASSETAGTVPAAASSGTATQAVEWGRGLFPGTPVTDTATTSAHAGVNTALPAWKTSAALSGKQSIESPGSKTAATADARPAEHTRGTHKADSGNKDIVRDRFACLGNPIGRARSGDCRAARAGTTIGCPSIGSSARDAVGERLRRSRCGTGQDGVASNGPG